MSVNHLKNNILQHSCTQLLSWERRSGHVQFSGGVHFPCFPLEDVSIGKSLCHMLYLHFIVLSYHYTGYIILNEDTELCSCQDSLHFCRKIMLSFLLEAIFLQSPHTCYQDDSRHYLSHLSSQFFVPSSIFFKFTPRC